jgi:hypothetical protein
MSAENWMNAAKTEEQRLLGEIAKTDLFKQLEAVRRVIALYQGIESSTEGKGLGLERGPEAPRVWKAAS